MLNGMLKVAVETAIATTRMAGDNLMERLSIGNGRMDGLPR